MNHRQLRSELQFYNRLRKTTQAIKLVTLSKLQRIQLLLKFRKFSLIHSRALFIPFSNISKDVNESHLVVLVTTERSCCGPIDQLLALYVQEFVKGLNSGDLNKFNSLVKFFFLGKKGFFLMKKKFKSNLYQTVYKLKSLSIRNASVISELIASSGFDNIHIFHNMFENVFTQNPSFYSVPSFSKFYNLFFSLKPFSHQFLSALSDKKFDLYFMKDLYDFNLMLLVFSTLNDNFVSEVGGRVFAMDMAIQNLSEIIHRCNINYQKSRQNAITNELIEIISCLNVLVVQSNDVHVSVS